MNIDKFINWDEIWSEEICLQTSIDCLEEDDDKNIEIISVIKQFQQDKDVELIISECTLNEGKLIFFFSETGGQNESDNYGWSRDYTFVVDSDFMIINAGYSQG